MYIKKMLKKIPPFIFLLKKILNSPFYQKIEIHKSFSYDKLRFFSHAGFLHDNAESLLAEIIAKYHVIEKGLTMPNPRLGFGQEALMELISKLKKYAGKYDPRQTQFLHAVSVVAEYLEFHRRNKFLLPSQLISACEELVRKAQVIPAAQICLTKEEFFSKNEASFEFFSHSRRTVRNFSGIISIKQIEEAVALANNAPSACNRQPWAVHLINDQALIQQCLSLQNGNRGFGHLFDKLLIVSVNLNSLIWTWERNSIFVDGGMYLMNLCYSLHRNKIGTCLLNWAVSPKTDKTLRKLIKMPPSETIIAFLGCGGVPEQLNLVISPRKTAKDTLTVH